MPEHRLLRVDMSVAQPHVRGKAPRESGRGVGDRFSGRPQSSRPAPSTPIVSIQMSAQRRRETGPELALRRALHSLGLRYRIHYPVPGVRRCTIDVAFPGRKIAVFVDGCFWHRCPAHRTVPKSNAAWWSAKLDSNVSRDRRIDDVLEQAGWHSIRVWEHESTADAVALVLEAINRSDHDTPKVMP